MRVMYKTGKNTKLSSCVWGSVSDGRVPGMNHSRRQTGTDDGVRFKFDIKTTVATMKCPDLSESAGFSVTEKFHVQVNDH